VPFRSARGGNHREVTTEDDERPEPAPPAPEQPATEGDRAWRERTQRTGRQAEELQPPHDRDAERRSPTPNP
jgi:hypothetical protein